MAKEEKSKAKSGLSCTESNMHNFFASIDRQKKEEENEKLELSTVHLPG